MKWLFFVLLAIKREQKSRTRKIVRTNAQQRLQKVRVPYRKLTDCSCFGREHRTHLEELAFVRFVRTGITLFFDLLQGLVSSAVQLELEDVDIVGSFYNTIYPSFTLLFFGINGIATHHPHEQVERIMEVAFAFTLGFLATHGVGNVCQEGSEELADLFQIASLQCTYYITCPTSGILFRLQIVIGNQSNKTFLPSSSPWHG